MEIQLLKHSHLLLALSFSLTSFPSMASHDTELMFEICSWAPSQAQQAASEGSPQARLRDSEPPMTPKILIKSEDPLAFVPYSVGYGRMKRTYLKMDLFR